MTVDLDAFSKLLAAVAWPAAVTGAAVMFRKDLPRFLEVLARRATKVSAFHLSIDLATVPEFAPTWSGPNLSDVRQPGPADEFSSAATALFEELKKDEASDYAVVDLGAGDKWLTSRLFIFAIMLHRMRGLRCFVFLETGAGVSRQFIGTCSPVDVRWALARKYPWLEDAFATAYAATPNRQIRSLHGGLESWPATQVVQAFLRQVQTDQASEVSAGEWVQLGSTQAWEHAKWLDGSSLTRTLGNALHTAWMPEALDAPAAERTKAALRRGGDYVALLEEGRRFKSLVDRRAVLETLATRAEES